MRRLQIHERRAVRRVRSCERLLGSSQSQRGRRKDGILGRRRLEPCRAVEVGLISRVPEKTGR